MILYFLFRGLDDSPNQVNNTYYFSYFSIRRSEPKVIALGREYERALAAQIIMLAPLAPHFASELWAGFCSTPRLLENKNITDTEIQWEKDVLQQNWPEVDMEYNLDLTVYVSRYTHYSFWFHRYLISYNKFYYSISHKIL